MLILFQTYIIETNAETLHDIHYHTCGRAGTTHCAMHQYYVSVR